MQTASLLSCLLPSPQQRQEHRIEWDSQSNHCLQPHAYFRNPHTQLFLDDQVLHRVGLHAADSSGSRLVVTAACAVFEGK